MGEGFPNRMSPVAFASLSHITNLINSIASGSLLQVQSFFDIVGLSFFNLSLKYIYTYLFMAVLLNLHCFAWAFSSHREQGLLFLGVHRHLTAVVPFVEHRPYASWFSSCGSEALEHRLSSCAWA